MDAEGCAYNRKFAVGSDSLGVQYTFAPVAQTDSAAFDTDLGTLKQS